MTMRDRIYKILNAAIDKGYLYPFNALHLQNSGVLDDIMTRWNEPHRRWHSIQHLENFLNFLCNKFQDTNSLTEEDFYKLLVAAIYHDVVYNPREHDNEEQSINILYRHFQENVFTKEVQRLIMITKSHEWPEERLGKVMFAGDWDILISGNLPELLKYEDAVFQEYQFIAYPDYKQARAAFLNHALSIISGNQSNIQFLINYVENRRPKIGVYAGSFNPIHVGHLDIACKASKIFDKVILLQAINPDKIPVELLPELMMTPSWARKVPYEVVTWKELLVDYLALVREYADVTLVRGLRNEFDLNAEFNQLQFNRELDPDLNIVWIPCDATLQHISSSALRALMRLAPEKAKKFTI